MKKKLSVLIACLLLCLSLSNHPAFSQVLPSSRQIAAYKEQIAAAATKNDLLQVLKVYEDLGSYYVSVSEFALARFTLTQAVDLAKQYLSPNHPTTGWLTIKLGAVYLFEQNFDAALLNLREGRLMLEQNPDFKATSGKLRLLESLIATYTTGIKALQAEQDFPKAEASFKATLKLAEQLNQLTLRSVSLSSIGLAQVMLDKDHDAEVSLKQALQFAEMDKSPEGRLAAQMGFVELYTRRGDISLAKQYLDQLASVPPEVLAHVKINKELLTQEQQKYLMIQETLDKITVPASAENYLEDAPIRNQIFRWNDQTRAIKIYMVPGNFPGWKPEYAAGFKRACQQWQNVLNNKITFEFTDNPADKVDTVVTWTAGYYPKAGLTEYRFVPGKLVRADIKFHLATFNNQLYDTGTVYKVSLHEVGHLLGIGGHSKNPNDIMFPCTTTSKTISPRDAQTMLRLYEQKPEITNPEGMTLAEFREANPRVLDKMLMKDLNHF